MRVIHVFLVSLLIALVLQGYFWKNVMFSDRDDWLETAQYIADGDRSVRNLPTYGYPGGPPLALTKLLATAGIPVASAYPGSIAVLNALTIAIVAILCRLLRPTSLWWVASLGILSIHPLYFQATPPSALVAPVAVAILLLIAYLSQRVSKPMSGVVVLGMLCGVAIALRFDISLLLLLVLAPYLYWLLSPRQCFLLVALAALTFAATNPYVWLLPIDHISAFITKARYHYANDSLVQQPLWQLLLVTAFALVSITMTTGLLLSRLTNVLPRAFLWYTLGATGVITLIVLNAQYRAAWYFLPLVFFWEIMIPAHILQLLDLNHPSYPWRHTTTGQILVVAGCIAVYASLLTQHYWLQ